MLQEEFTQETVDQKVVTVALDGWGNIFCLRFLSGTVWVPCHARAAEFLLPCHRYPEAREMEYETIVSFHLAKCLDKSITSLFFSPKFIVLGIQFSPDIPSWSCKIMVSASILIQPNLLQVACMQQNPLTSKY